MSMPAGALSPSTSNIPSKRKRKNTQRVLSDSEDTSEREDSRAVNVPSKSDAVGPEPPRKDRKRRRKKRRRHSIVENVDSMRASALQAPGISSPKLTRKRSRSMVAKSGAAPVAGPSTAFVRSNTPDIASSPTARSVSSPEPPALPAPTALSLKGKGRAIDVEVAAAPLDISTLSAELAELKGQLAAKNEALSNQRNLLSNLQASLTCQICLDPLHKPYALAPCGHVACHTCLVAWFRAPPPDVHPDDILPVLTRKKTCPHCRAVLRERPIEVWAVKDMVGSFYKSGLADPPMNPPVAPPAPVPAAPANERADPWDGIFRKSVATAAGGGLFFPDPPVPVHMHEILGLHDAEDGGIFRCIDCGHEIWDGVCSSCARVYPGHPHRPGIPWSDDDDDEDDDDDDSDHGGWMDGMLFGNVPWQFGLGADSDDSDGGEGEDRNEGDDDDSRDADEGPGDGARNAFLGWLEQHMPPVRVGQQDEADEDEEGEGGDDGGYESSFIDDENAEDTGHAAPVYSPSHELPVSRDGGVWAEDDGDDGDDGAEDYEDEDEDVEYGPTVPVRRNRLVVNSDDEENGASGDGYSDSGLADAVAERERHIYGDDGSIPRVDIQSSSPLRFDSDTGSDIEADAPYHAFDDGARSADDDEHNAAWSDNASEDDAGYDDHGYSDGGCDYHDEDPSGDEYEYGDAAW